MRYLPFRRLVLCVLLPPILYLVSIQLLNTCIDKYYQEALEAVYIGDTKPLFDGSIALKEAVSRQVDGFIEKQRLIGWGLKIDVTVLSKSGQLIYPAVFKAQPDVRTKLDPLNVASDNFSLLNDGLELRVDARINHNTAISNLLLVFYILIAVLLLWRFYGAGLARSDQDRALERQKALAEIEQIHQQASQRLTELESERRLAERQLKNYRQMLEKEREKTSETEDEMLQEMLSLEEKMTDNLEKQRRQQEEITRLKKIISERQDSGKKEKRQRTKAADTVARRFKTLYKQLSFNQRAIDGFVNLSDDMKLKAEEVVFQLNQNYEKVSIKRKVFGKKNRETVFEVIFGYRGRLYFRNTAHKTVEILSIGTKHTQSKDLAFLDKL